MVEFQRLMKFLIEESNQWLWPVWNKHNGSEEGSKRFVVSENGFEGKGYQENSQKCSHQDFELEHLAIVN